MYMRRVGYMKLAMIHDRNELCTLVDEMTMSSWTTSRQRVVAMKEVVAKSSCSASAW